MMHRETPHRDPGTHIVRVFGDLRFHTDGDIVALAFPSRQRIWSVEDPGVLRHWDTDKGQAVDSVFLSDLETLWSFSEDGQLLISGNDEVSIWEVANGKKIATMQQPSWVTALAYRKKPALLATGHDDGIVRMWDPKTRQPVRELPGHDLPISALSFSPEGKRLASASEDRIIRIWDVKNGKLLGTLDRHSDRIQELAWHPQGNWLVSAAWDRTARIWDTATMDVLVLLNTHADQVNALAFSPDGNMLGCADSANSIHIWDPAAGKELHVLNEHQEEIRCLAFSPDGKILASGGADRMIYFWDPHEGRLVSGGDRPVSNKTQLAPSPDGKRLASTGGGVHFRWWNITSGKLDVQPQGQFLPEVIAASPDGRWLAGGGKDKQITLWHAGTGRIYGILTGQAGKVAALAFSPDSAMLASASASDGTVWLWNVLTREPALVIPLAADGCTVETLAFHPRGHLLAVGGVDWLATGGRDGAIGLWDLLEHLPVATFCRGAAHAVFHPSGRWLAAASLNDSVCVWELESQDLMWELTGPADKVTSVAFSPDGKLLAAGSDDRTIRFWNAQTGDALAVHGLDSPIKALSFSPDGDYLFTGNGNTTSYQLKVQSILEEAFVG
ncbi:MAG TPA: WD40 repeat domain-containing protein [Gemmataceae bacterium]|nr:WD40 repeat domain-containing protein [Gemmataceae bacterium]